MPARQWRLRDACGLSRLNDLLALWSQAHMPTCNRQVNIDLDPHGQTRTGSRSSRSRTAMSGHIVFGSNNFRSIRRSGHIVQDRPLWSVRWADIPQLSAWDASCPAAWQQYWLQSRRWRLLRLPSAIPFGSDAADAAVRHGADGWRAWHQAAPSVRLGRLKDGPSQERRARTKVTFGTQEFDPGHQGKRCHPGPLFSHQDRGAGDDEGRGLDQPGWSGGLGHRVRRGDQGTDPYRACVGDEPGEPSSEPERGRSACWRVVVLKSGTDLSFCFRGGRM